MAGEWREGDWECPDCGAQCFASKATCFKCDRAGGGGGGDNGFEKREGDWECPDCGANVFASKDSCFKCDRAGGAGVVGKGDNGREKREGDWDCPDCGAHVFASKDTCYRCEARARDPGGGKGGKGKGSKGGGKGMGSLADALKMMNKSNKAWQAAWGGYCDAYAEGWKDPGRHEASALQEFLEYAAGLIQADLNGGGAAAGAAEAAGEAEEPAAAPAAVAPAAAAAGKKRPAPKASAAAPPEKKKITVKKAVAAKVQELNKSGVLTVEVRLGAVAGALAQLEESAQLEALGLLEEQAEDIEDPNEFLKNQAQVMLAAAEEG